MKGMRGQIVVGVFLFSLLPALSTVPSQERGYPVKHLPMLEKHLCYVLLPSGTEVILVDLLESIEIDARDTGKRKSLAIVSSTLTDRQIIDARRKIEGGLQQTTVQKVDLNPDVIRDMIEGEGVRFVFLNTQIKSAFPSELVEHVKTVSKGKVDIDGLYKSPDTAGYHVCWQWKQKRKKNQMWVILYAPGPHTLRGVTAKCVEAVAHAGGNNTREPYDIFSVSMWAYAIDKEIATNHRFQELYRTLLQYLIERSSQGGEWVEPHEVPLNSNQALSEVIQKVQENNWNCVGFVLHKNINEFLGQTDPLFGSLKGALENLKPTQVAVITNEESRSEAKRVCYVAATPGLIRRAIAEVPDFSAPSPVRVEVPDLKWVKHVAIVFTRNAKAAISEGGRSRLLQELKVRFGFWQVYDETILEGILNLESIGLQGLPGGATPGRSLPVDAMLVIDVGRFQIAGSWVEVGHWELQTVKGEWVKWDRKRRPDPPSALTTPPFDMYEPSPPSKKEIERKPEKLDEWRAKHRAWWEAKREWESKLRSDSYEARLEVAYAEVATADIACSLIDMRPSSTGYGVPVHSELVLPSISRETLWVRDRGIRKGLFRYKLVEEGSSPHLRVSLAPTTPNWEPLPRYKPNPNSPAALEAPKLLADDIRQNIEEASSLQYSRALRGSHNDG